jgi:CheY-like chemotaxis protein
MAGVSSVPVDDVQGRAELREQFDRARVREMNGALLAIRVGDPGAAGDARAAEAVRGATRGRSEVSVYRLDETVLACIVPSCSAPEARAAAETIRSALAPAPVAVGITNFYEFFTADGTASEIVREVERSARSRLETAARRGSAAISDTSDPSAPGGEQRPSVFVIEPDPVSVELLSAALDAAGFEVLSFQNGEAAIASLEASPPSLVICEAMTPRLNGFVIRERLRASPRLEAIPFILVSHRKTEEMIRRAVEADIRHFFRKPLSIAEIVGLAANLTRSRSR